MIEDHPFRTEMARGGARLILLTVGFVVALGSYIGVHYLADAIDRFDDRRKH